mmetsp:Transcript_28555/g.73586  ORF Transcript_28555/g.73586 Transcript_28555/m.73586 type:complete len:228 (+) Transcript_28555:76-759(+)
MTPSASSKSLAWSSPPAAAAATAGVELVVGSVSGIAHRSMGLPGFGPSKSCQEDSTWCVRATTFGLLCCRSTLRMKRHTGSGRPDSPATVVASRLARLTGHACKLLSELSISHTWPRRYAECRACAHSSMYTSSGSSSFSWSSVSMTEASMSTFIPSAWEPQKPCRLTGAGSSASGARLMDGWATLLLLFQPCSGAAVSGGAVAAALLLPLRPCSGAAVSDGAVAAT